MAQKRIAIGKPVQVIDPMGENRAYDKQLGIVKDSDLLFGGVWNHLVQLNSGRKVWFMYGELKVLKNT